MAKGQQHFAEIESRFYRSNDALKYLDQLVVVRHPIQVDAPQLHTKLSAKCTARLDPSRNKGGKAKIGIVHCQAMARVAEISADSQTFASSSRFSFRSRSISICNSVSRS